MCIELKTKDIQIKKSFCNSDPKLFDHTGSEIVMRLKIQYMGLVHILRNLQQGMLPWWPLLGLQYSIGSTSAFIY